MATERDAYGSIARFYDRALGSMTTSVRARAIRMWPPRTGMRVLDVGCGTGMYLEAYSAAGSICTGIDLSPSMLAVAAERLGDRAHLELADATIMPFADGSFDLVMASLLLHELDGVRRSVTLDEMARVMAPDGRMLIVDYRAGPLRWKGRLARALAVPTERIAGATHMRNWRAYLAEAGIPAMVPDGIRIEVEKVIAGGNLAVWLLAVDPS